MHGGYGVEEINGSMKKPLIHPKSALKSARVLKTLFTECCKARGSKLNTKGCWQPPEVGSLKLNIDGSLFANTQSAGVGMVLMDHTGNVLLATSMKESNL